MFLDVFTDHRVKLKSSLSLCENLMDVFTSINNQQPTGSILVGGYQNGVQVIKITKLGKTYIHLQQLLVTLK